MQEHGIKGKAKFLLSVLNSAKHSISVYFTGTWNGFDLAFGSSTHISRCYQLMLLAVTTYAAYAILRIYGVYHDGAHLAHTSFICC